MGKGVKEKIEGWTLKFGNGVYGKYYYRLLGIGSLPRG
jgi:hypothetical protein